MAHTIQFMKLDAAATIPTRGTAGSAGFDLYALETTVVGDGTTRVRTGIACVLPENTYGHIYMRSGLALREHLGCTAGVIDADYRGEIGGMVFVTNSQKYTIAAGERFAQLVIEHIDMSPAEEIFELPSSSRDTGGFGSTGKF